MLWFIAAGQLSKIAGLGPAPQVDGNPVRLSLNNLEKK